MATPLLQQFPSLATYPPNFLKDLLSSPQLIEAFLFTLPEVQGLAAEVEKLGKENEEMASTVCLVLIGDMAEVVERNIDLRDELFALRDATAQSYSHAEALKMRWADIEKTQANFYQVRPNPLIGKMIEADRTSDKDHPSYTCASVIPLQTKTTAQRN